MSRLLDFLIGIGGPPTRWRAGGPLHFDAARGRIASNNARRAIAMDVVRHLRWPDLTELPAPNPACAEFRMRIARVAAETQLLVGDLEWLVMQCKNGIALSQALRKRLKAL
jgi:hypothetical protein